MVMLAPCPRCARQWSRTADGGFCCLPHGEYHAIVSVEPPKAKQASAAWSTEEKEFVLQHLDDMSFRAIAEDITRKAKAWHPRTQKSVEHLVYLEGWDKGYVREEEEVPLAALPRGLAPADRAVAVLLRERALNGWTVSTRALARATGLRQPNLHRAIRRLIRAGLVECVTRQDGWHGNRPNTYRWVISDTDIRVGGEE